MMPATTIAIAAITARATAAVLKQSLNDPQRYASFANHPLFRVSRMVVKGGKALPVLAVAGGALAYGENVASGDTSGRAATRATVSTGFGMGAGLLAGAGVSGMAAVLGIGLAGGPAGVAIAGAAIIAAVGAGWVAQQLGDDVGWHQATCRAAGTGSLANP
jgi:hypothetical protein